MTRGFWVTTQLLSAFLEGGSVFYCQKISIGYIRGLQNPCYIPYNGVLCVSVCSNWLDLEPAANKSGMVVGARPTFERCGFEVRVGGGDCMCDVSSLCGKPKGSE